MSSVDHEQRTRRARRARRERGPKRPENRRFDRHRKEFANANFASAIYGQILVLSVLAAVDSDTVTAAVVLETVLGSQLVFWLAHAYAESISRQVRSTVEHRDGIGWRGVVDVMEHEWPLVQSAVPTIFMTILSLAGAVSVRTAVDVSLGLGIFALFAWAMLAGRRAGRPLISQLIAAALSSAFGLGIVALKLLTH